MIELMLLAVVAGLVISFLDLKWGMYATLMAGFLQDPLRKLFVDEPIYLSALVIVFAAVTFIGARARGAVARFDSIPGWNERMQGPVYAFVAVVVLQSIATVFYTGSPILAGIGLLAYLSPFPAFLMAYSFASDINRVRRYLLLYVVACAAMASGVYLTWLGVDLDILRTVGEPLTIYLLETGEAIDLPSGFFRVPELAAWHAAAGCCFSVILGLAGRRAGGAWASAMLGLFFLGVVLLTGRRKFVVEIVVFLPFLAILLIRFRAGSSRLLWSLFAISVVGGLLAISHLVTNDTKYAIADASSRSDQDLSQELFERVSNMTIGAFEHVLDTNGVFGSGAGSGSQGAQHFGGGDQIIGYAAEGGLGKILAELGVPGFIVILWVGIRFVAFIWGTLDSLTKGGRQGAQIATGLAAFLIVSAIVFMSAHQAFGDLFVLLVIGTCFGFIAAGRRFAVEEQVPSPHQSENAAFRSRAHYDGARLPR